MLSMVAMGHAINPLIYKTLPYDGENDFTPISLIATFPQLVLVHPAVKARSLGELIALAKARSPLTYASGGNGSSQHLAGAVRAHGRPHPHACGLQGRQSRAAEMDTTKGVVAQQGGEMVASMPEQFATFIEAERRRYADIVREAGMLVE
jgi:tripartite-type tricarboxylate transporter receptor subunit TctC